MTGLVSYDYTRAFSDSYRYRIGPSYTITQDNREESWQQSVYYQAALEHKTKQVSWGFIAGGDVNPYHEFGNYLDDFFDGAGHQDSSNLTHSTFHNSPATFYGNAHLAWTSAHIGRTLSADADFDQYHEGNHQDETTFDSIPYELQDFQTFIARIYGLKTDYTDKFGSHVYLEAGLRVRNPSART